MAYPHNGKLVVTETEIANGQRQDAEPEVPIVNSHKWAAHLFNFCKKEDLTGPLFAHRPSIDDVRQGNMGDCFLLAAILAIVEKPGGPEFIEKMMVLDPKANRVTVRFFVPWDELESTTAPIQARRYVTVEYSRIVPYFYDEQVGSQGAAWVHILEKAYAGFDKGNLWATGKPGILWNLDSGGNPQDTLRALRGAKTGMVALLAAAGTLSRDGKTQEIKQFDAFMTTMEVGFFSAEELAARFSQEDQQELRAWLAQTASAWIAFFAGFYSPNGNPEALKPLRLTDVLGFLESQGCRSEFVTIIMRQLEAKQVFPGKRSSGQYSRQQIEFHDALTLQINAGMPVAASSRNYEGLFDKIPLRKGLVWSHAYALLSGPPPAPVAQSSSDVTSGSAGTAAALGGPGGALRDGVRGVWLCNPWGHRGRAYVRKTDGKTQATEKTARIFWIDLSDLTKRFWRVSHCLAVPPPPPSFPPPPPPTAPPSDAQPPPDGGGST